jgi:hypothetical protein
MAFDKTWGKPKAEAINKWNRRYVYGRTGREIIGG